MGFLDGFRDGFKTALREDAERNFSEREPPRRRPEDAADTAEYEAAVRELTAENERLAAELNAAQHRRASRDDAALREEIGRLTETIADRDAELAEAKSLVADLATEAEKLSAELKVRRRAEPQGRGDEKYKKLRRVVLKRLHPDTAGADKRLAAALDLICRELNAEIDRIEAA
jgi:chromosome segregation ATPase